MIEQITGLSLEEKKELALAFLLWKEFKSSGRLNPEVERQAIKMAQYFGLQEEYEVTLLKMPSLKIVPR